jgi:hypothetical protein
MTQFLTLRQVFENFSDHRDQIINFFAVLLGFFRKPHLFAAKPSIMAQLFGPWQVF